MQKIYCYVDETGQDTQGRLFIVSVIVAGDERQEMSGKLERIEQETQKGRVKWMKARDDARVAYIERVLTSPVFKNKLAYASYQSTTEYLARTVLTTARAITIHSEKDYKATIFVDGLPRSQTRWFGSELRHLRIRTKKVRGVRIEEASPLIRLADALCGFVRAAIEGREDLIPLLEKALAEGYIKEL